MTAFESEAELKANLSAVGASAVASGLVLGSGGNLSARIPGVDEFVVTGAGTWLDALESKHFTRMTLAGEVVHGAPNPSSEWKMHQRTYQARPDVNAVVHLHPQYAVLIDALGHEIRLFTLDHISYVKSVGVIPFYPNGSDELADSAAQATLEHDCVVLSHHGCSAVGSDIPMAYRRAMNLEEAATATYRSLLLGDTTTAFPTELSDAQHA